jgi:pimeloyl-ACP methyl ester carboxylesterase
MLLPPYTTGANPQEGALSANPQDGFRPTVVLVHGAFAESASWNDMIGRLQDQGYTVIAAANPIRSVSGDAEFVASIFEAVEGPIVAVGHSYGGTVITNAVRDNDNVEALVYVAGYAPEEGESSLELSGRFLGSTLGETLWSVPLSDGSTDLYIQQEKYHGQFAEDVPAEQTALMAVGQRPLWDVAANEASGPPAWRSIPSWFVFGELDKNIPVAAHRFMAERAGAREVVEIEGASHAVGVSHPEEVANVILRAAKDVE